MDTTHRISVRPVEAAELLSIGRSTIYQLISEGAIPSVRIAGILRVPLEALKAITEPTNEKPEKSFGANEIRTRNQRHQRRLHGPTLKAVDRENEK